MSAVFPALISLATNARALVIGGTGVCGSGIVQAMLKQGAQVVVVNRCKESFEELLKKTPEQFHPNLSSVLGDVTTEEGVKEVFKNSVALGPIQHVVASIRGEKTWWQCGHLVDQSLKKFYEVMKDDVTGHFLLMKHFLPYLAENIGTTYTIITGYPGSGSTSQAVSSSRLALSAGILTGLSDGARADFRDSKVAVSEFKMKCLVYDQDDQEVCARGTQHLGNDLIGQAVTAGVARLTREKVVINERDDARAWSKTKSHADVAQDIWGSGYTSCKTEHKPSSPGA